MMLPPLPPNLQISNPQFAILYSTLSTSLLNPSGSIPPPSHEAKSRAKIAEELHDVRIANAKIEIMRSGLKSLMSEDMAEELQDLILLLSASSLTATALTLPAALSYSHPLRHLSTLLSTRLQTLHTSLSPLLSPPPSTRLDTLNHSRTLLTTNITNLTTTSTALLATHRAIAETGVQVLERVRFGVVGRAAIAEARYWSAMASGLRAKLEMWELDAWRKVERDDERVSRALERYAGWLKEWRRALEDREAAARDQLEDFEAVPGMEGILKIWKGLAEERRAVREMVRRLDGAEGERTLSVGRTT